MQFKSIITVLSIALAATAIPLAVEDANLAKRTGGSCNSDTQTPSKCTSTTGASLGLLDLLSLLSGIAATIQCVPVLSGNSANACCSGAPQSGNLIAVNTVCIPIL